VQGNLLGDSDTEAVRTYAGHRSVIDQKQLHQGANRSLDDALQKVPGVKIQDETGTGVLPQIAVRGLNDSRSGRTQVLVDGTPLALAPYGQLGLSLFPVTMQTIDRIDVVRGGAAVQYGPNNVGGVINLISRPIPDAWENQIGVGTSFYDHSGHSLWDTYFRTGGGVSDDLALQLEGNYLKGEGVREHSDTQVQNWQLRSRWNMTDNQSLQASVQRYDADAQLPGALSKEAWEADPRQSQRPHDSFAGDTWRGTLAYNLVLDRLGPFDWAELNWSNFLHRSNRSFEFGFNTAKGQSWNPALAADVTRNSPRTFVTWGTEPRLTGYIAGNGVNQQWTLGTRFVKEDIDYKVNQTVLDSGAGSTMRDWRFDDKAVAAYVSNAIMLLDDRLVITPGVRLEDARMAYEDQVSGTSRDNRSTEWLPGLTVGYQLSDSWFTYANGQRSLRPPQVTQIVKEGDVGAELAWNYETGVRFTPSQALSLGLGLFRIDYADQIEYSASTANFVNLGETRHQGVESELLWRPQALADLTLRGGYAYLDAKQRSGEFAGNQVPAGRRLRPAWLPAGGIGLLLQQGLLRCRQYAGRGCKRDQGSAALLLGLEHPAEHGTVPKRTDPTGGQSGRQQPV